MALELGSDPKSSSHSTPMVLPTSAPLPGLQGGLTAPGGSLQRGHWPCLVLSFPGVQETHHPLWCFHGINHAGAQCRDAGGLWGQFAIGEGGSCRWLLISTQALGVPQQELRWGTAWTRRSERPRAAGPELRAVLLEMVCSPGCGRPSVGAAVRGRAPAGRAAGAGPPHSSPGCSPTVHLAFTSRKGVMSS